MKNRGFILSFLILLITNFAFAQTTSKKVNYQAVVRNAANELVTNESLSVEITILNANNVPQYRETHASVSTNQNGLLWLWVGEGTPTLGTLDEVVWKDATIQSVFTLPGGNTVTQNTPVSAMPYAYYADEVDTLFLQDYLTTHNYGNEDYVTHEQLDDTLSRYTTTDKIDTLLGVYFDSTRVKTAIHDTADAIRAAIPATQVNADWNATGGPAEILNKPDLSVYATNAHLNDTLNSFATKDTLSAYATKDTLAYYATTNALKDSLTRYVDKDKLTDTLDSYYTKNNIDSKLNDYEKKSDLCGDVKECIKDTLGKYTTTDKIDTLLGAYFDSTQVKSVISDTADAIRAAIPATQVNADWNATGGPAEILNKPDLSVYATTNALKDSLTRYVDKDKLTDTLDSYYTKNNIDSKLNDYEKKSDLCGDVKECIKDTLGKYTTSNQIDTLLGVYFDSTQVKTAIHDTADAIRAAIPASQVNADWNATGGPAEILNKPDLSVYATNAHLNDTLNSFATKDTLSAYATKDTLANFATTNALKDSLSQYVGKSKLNDTLDRYYTKDNVDSKLNDYEKKSDLCGDVKECIKDTLGKYTTTNQIDTLLGAYYDTTQVKNAIHDTADAIRAAIPATQVQSDWTETDDSKKSYIQHKPDLGVYATKDTLNAFATKDTLANFATTNALKDSLTRYVDKDKLTDTLDSYYTKNNVDNILNDYEKKSDLCGDVKECIKDTLGKYTTTDKIDTLLGAYFDSTQVKTAIHDTADAIRAAIPATQVQSDWTETDDSKKSYIQHKPDLGVYATKDTLNAFATKDTLANFATTNALKDSLTRYVDKDKLTDTLDSYYTKNNVDNILNDYEKKSDLCGDVKECIKDTLDKYTTTNKIDTLLSVYFDTTHVKTAIHDSLTQNVELTIKSDSLFLKSGGDIDTVKLPAVPEQVKSDWKETNTSSAAYILNKPVIKDSVNMVVKDSLGAANSAINKAIDTIALNVVKDTLKAYYDTARVKALVHDSIGNGKITIQKNGATITNGSFNLNQKTDQTINITVPTTVAELTDEANYAKVAADNQFTGTNTVPRGFVISGNNATNGDNCNNIVVNACDLWAVFDSLRKRIENLEGVVNDLSTELAAVKNAVPPTYTTPNGLVASDTTAKSVKVTASFTSDVPITSYQFCYSKNADMSNSTCISNATNEITLQNLMPNTHYYVTASATNLAGTTNATDTIDIRTKANKPNATVVLNSTTPAGFSVALSDITLGGAAVGSVQVCYLKKENDDCPEIISNCETAVEIDSTQKTNSQNITGKDPEEYYCVKVIVSNEDSNYVYFGEVKTGKDLTLNLSGPTSMNLCGSTKEATYLAELDGDDVANFTVVWNNSDSTGLKNVVSFSDVASDSLIKCILTRSSDNMVLSAEIRTTVTNGTDHIPSFTTCENGNTVTVKSVSETTSLEWGDNTTKADPQVGDEKTYPAGKDTVYTITASGSDGCTATKRVAVGKGSIAPCKGTPHTGTGYEGNGYNSSNDGYEYGGVDSITAVTDYVGNIYSVVQIGSQCWLAENMRCKRSPSKNVSFFKKEGAGDDDYVHTSRWMAAHWLDNDADNGGLGYGLLYNWCAAVDTFDQADGYSPAKKGSGTGQKANGWDCVFNSLYRRGVCPKGWHIPSKEEWNELIGQFSYASELTKSCYWEGSSQNTHKPNDYSDLSRNVSGFGALPAGFFEKGENGEVNGEDSEYLRASFWSCSQNSTNNNQAMGMSLTYNISNITWFEDQQKFKGFSVRCLRDQYEILTLSSSPENPSICQGGGEVSVTYSASVTEYGEEATGYTYSWNGSSPSTDPSFTVVYTTTGTYTVTCTATNGTIHLEKTIKTTVTTSLPSFTTCTDGITVTIKDPEDISKYVWAEGDTNTNTSHTYPSMGTYTVTAMSSAGCTTTETVEVVESPFTRTPCLVKSYHDYGTVGYNGAKDGFEKTVGGNTSYIDSVMDYEGNIYPVVQIGSQCWLAENMRCTRSPGQNGALLTDSKDINGNSAANNEAIYTRLWMAAHWYGNNSTDNNKFGLLYNWCAAVDTFFEEYHCDPTGPGSYSNESTKEWDDLALPAGPRRGVCPKGWHIPSTAEWSTLVSSGNYKAGDLAKGCDWTDSPNGARPGDYSYTNRNSSSFAALPAGCFKRDNITSPPFKMKAGFSSVNTHAYFWSSTLSDYSEDEDVFGQLSKCRFLQYNDEAIINPSIGNKPAMDRANGYSVRCLRDEDIVEVLISTAPYSPSLCGESSVSVTYTASVKINGMNDNNYTYSWSAPGGENVEPGDNSGSTFTVSYKAIGTYTVTCTATKVGEDPIVQVNTLTVGAGSYPVFSICENDHTVTIKYCNNAVSFTWEEGGTPGTSLSHTYTVDGVYEITATSGDGCTTTKQVAVGNASLHPCTVANPHTDYSGNGYNNADDGKETVVDGKVNTVTDYDGNIYPVVQIGSQCWMAENMRCEHSPSHGGVSILNPDNLTGLRTSHRHSSQVAQWYMNDASYASQGYGLLYNWCAAVDTFNANAGATVTTETGNWWACTFNGPRRGICPKGWHVPTSEEWTQMETAVGGAGKLSKSCDWAGSSTLPNRPNSYYDSNRNSSGFGVLPAGYSEFSAAPAPSGGYRFNGVGENAYFWTTTSHNDASFRYVRILKNDDVDVSSDYKDTSKEYSVRCVRDAE